ncbi:ExbD/TolR family protein [Lentibacter sp. XHP0401]|uniref:ExbD/TolR family protein n=1 Tax=Lentibacter sp. XHP0401 TaxID=2984334 RepID=UPI0021E78F23|nr:biopolymer transporter ExbD [Lentibacter sp. XHP0401]MCV2892763.1 biopolymer transporter ExbD [Lentibacter sp. XHP0401]
MSCFTTPKRNRRQPSLTPMIDVVFLLLVFFMLASRFGAGVVIPVPLSTGGVSLSPSLPRLVDILPSGYRFNGIPCEDGTLIEWLSAQNAAPEATVVLRADPMADVQRLVDTATLLRQAGFTALAVAE